MLKKSAFVILTSRTNPEACLTNNPLGVADFAMSANPFHKLRAQFIVPVIDNKTIEAQ
jgi:hypothetical protein